MHYFPLHIKDFSNASRHLSDDEELIHFRALTWYYSNEKPLPLNKTKIYRLLRATTKKMKIAVDSVLEDFFTEEEDGFHQRRCDREIAFYHSKQATAAKAGKASAEARRKIDVSKTTVNPNDNRHLTVVEHVDENKVNECSTDVQPTINHQPKTKNHSINISFNEFWNLYDKKVGDKNKIEVKWIKLNDSERIAIMQHIPLYKDAQPDKQYRKNPESYLNNKSWNDEIIQQGDNYESTSISRTNNTSATQPSHVEYARNIMGAIAREIGTTRSQFGVADSDRSNVFDMEISLQNENE